MKKITAFIFALLGINIGAKAQMEQLENGLKNVLELTSQKFDAFVGRNEQR